MDVTLRCLDFILWDEFQVGGASSFDFPFRKITLRRADSGGLEWRSEDAFGQYGAKQA